MHVPGRVVAVDARVQHQGPSTYARQTAGDTQSGRTAADDDGIVVGLGNCSGSQRTTKGAQQVEREGLEGRHLVCLAGERIAASP